MKLGLNGATIMPADLRTDISVAAAAGYDLLEIRDAKLDAFLEQGGTVAELAERLAAARLAPLSINALEGVPDRSSGVTPELRDRCARLAEIGGQIGARWIVAVPGTRAPELEPAAAIAAAVRAVDELAGVVAAQGLGLAYEFIGRAGSAVPTLADALAVLDQVRPEVGLVLDTFHFSAGGSALADVERIPAERLAVLHINDVEDRPAAELTDAHRLYPGEGVLPLGQIFIRLRQTGFTGPASVEVFRPEYWARDPGRVAREAHAASVGALQEGGLW